MRSRAAATGTLLVLVALAATGCADDTPPPGPGTSDTGSPSTGSPSSGSPPGGTRTPGDPETPWDPPVPATPVADADVAARYDAVLDAMTQAVDRQVPDLTWSASDLRTSEVDGACAVVLERTADGTVPPPGDDTLDLTAVDTVVAGAGFGAMRLLDDPGGGLRQVAEGPDGVRLELRSKEVASVAALVPTTPDACS